MLAWLQASDYHPGDSFVPLRATTIPYVAELLPADNHNVTYDPVEEALEFTDGFLLARNITIQAALYPDLTLVLWVKQKSGWDPVLSTFLLGSRLSVMRLVGLGGTVQLTMPHPDLPYQWQHIVLAYILNDGMQSPPLSNTPECRRVLTSCQLKKEATNCSRHIGHGPLLSTIPTCFPGHP